MGIHAILYNVYELSIVDIYYTVARLTRTTQNNLHSHSRIGAFFELLSQVDRYMKIWSEQSALESLPGMIATAQSNIYRHLAAFTLST